MALETFTGKLTDFSRTPFPTSAEVELRVKPERSAYGAEGLLADKPIDVAVASNGAFSFQLETTASVKPETWFVLEAKWLDHQGWTEWARFKATVGGGNLADIIELPATPWSISYGFGPPPAHITGLYIDITGPNVIFYGPDKGI